MKIKEKEIQSYKIKNNENIDFKKYSIYMQCINNFNLKLRKEYMIYNNYDNICKKMLLYQNYNKGKQLNNIFIDLEYKNFSPLKNFYYNFIKKRIKTPNNLIITNTFPILNQLNNLNIKLRVQLFENEERSHIRFINDIKKAKNLKNISKIENNTIINYLNKTKFDKYQNIICNMNEFYFQYYTNLFVLTKIPNILFVLVLAIQQLNKNGNLYLFTRISIMNPTLKKIIHLLVASFDKVDLINNNYDQNDTNILINCQKFKDNITKSTINNLIDICLKSRKYNYTLCQFMNYYYHIYKNNKNSKFLHSLDINDLDLPNNMEFNQATMNILDDIDINPTKSKKGNFLIYQMENLYEDYFNNVEINIKNYVKDVNGKVEIDEAFFNKVLYDKIILMVQLLDEYKIPYNKTYLTYINKYNKNIINNLFTYRNIIKYKLVKYDFLINSKLNNLKITSSKSSKKSSRKISRKISRKTNRKSSIKSSKKTHKKISVKKIMPQPQMFSKIGNYQSFQYSEGHEAQDLASLAYRVKESLLSNTKNNQLPIPVKKITEGFARGVSQYVNQVFKIPISLSNGFMKLWEIYCAIPQLIPNRKKFMVFHMAEAPGHWINCTKHFIKKRKSNIEEHDWVANSLNHKHPTNIEKFGKGIFGDQYGFIKKYPEKWLYGADNTGDITKDRNIKWFKKYLAEWCQSEGGKLNLITGDAGLVGEGISLKYLQKIEYSQMAMVANLSQEGGNCVIKHFLPFINGYPNSYNATGYFVGLIYCYHLMFRDVILIKPHTSNPNSGEFYLVGLKFIGLTEKQQDKIREPLSEFQENHCCFRKSDIPESFSVQVLEFIETMMKVRTEQYELQNMLITCIAHQDPVIEKATKCNTYLGEKFIKEIQSKRYKEWIKHNRFE